MKPNIAAWRLRWVRRETGDNPFWGLSGKRGDLSFTPRLWPGVSVRPSEIEPF